MQLFCKGAHVGMNTTHYDVIVVGAGHAGCEAAHAAARSGCRTLLLTIDLDKAGFMSCNPSIGGPAKGHLVREIDAMGGLMGRLIDRAAIQVRLLNDSKGPAVQALRAQADKRLYAQLMKETLEATPNLHVKQAMVERIVPTRSADSRLQIADPAGLKTNDDADHVQSSICNLPSFQVITHTGWSYTATALVLTTGTFLRGRAITGQAIWAAGRAGESPSVALGDDLSALGFPLVRLKTGTPPRVDARTIDWEQTVLQPGSATPLWFGFYYSDEGQARDAGRHPQFDAPPAAVYPHPQLAGWRPQLPCYLVYTNAAFHEVIRANLDRAPMFSGVIEGVGPRYCPSIEDKVVRFADKERHGMFLEPEGWTTHEVYVQGCNTSLPEDVQWQMLRAIPALRQAEIMRVGYAIEYDAVATGEVGVDLAARRLPGLYLAGQINGTTGYEEAAAQGLMAGLNASRYARGLPPVMLRRDQAYIGVLLDDLVTKEIREPYRMFTSRAEHRLLLRADNADLRLTPLAYAWGLVERERAEAVAHKQAATAALWQQLQATRLYPSAATNQRLEQAGLPSISGVTSAEELLRRPEVAYNGLRAALDLPEAPPFVVEQVEIGAKYGGYIAQQQREVERMAKMEGRQLPPDLDYLAVPGLRNEARQVLLRFRPATLGQAARLAGINPADIAILMLWVERRRRGATTAAS
jgi:tRNA uridine 5-carboxymethylaminomethyl modification enzyme